MSDKISSFGGASWRDLPPADATDKKPNSNEVPKARHYEILPEYTPIPNGMSEEEWWGYKPPTNQTSVAATTPGTSEGNSEKIGSHVKPSESDENWWDDVSTTGNPSGKATVSAAQTPDEPVHPSKAHDDVPGPSTATRNNSPLSVFKRQPKP